MMRLFKFLKPYKLKNSQRSHKTGGFTLIELLVGMIMTALIITPLLGFVINMMDTDRKEQAKATTEQEIQAALDYIARDLDQAFFIYDAWGLQQIQGDLPQVAGDIAGAEGVPVLVFWKREFIPNSVPIKNRNINDCANNDPNNYCDDGFVYSLVSYYLIRDTLPCNNPTWSCTTRIGRIELKDALYDVNNVPNNSDPAVPVSADYDRNDGLVRITELLKQPGSLEAQLNNWNADTNRGTYDYDETPFEILVDYVDQTEDAITAQPNCSQATRPPEAARPDGLPPGNDYMYRQVPANVPVGFPIDSFYACVNTDQTIAQVFIRGNALARLRPKNDPPPYAANQSAYFPSASIQAQGRGFLSANPNTQ
jgi:type II secretory pathway pseudopilin PulG